MTILVDFYFCIFLGLLYIYIVYTSGVERYKFSYAAMHVYFVNLFFPQKEMELSGGVGHIT
jgi:hypothetical protein